MKAHMLCGLSVFAAMLSAVPETACLRVSAEGEAPPVYSAALAEMESGTVIGGTEPDCVQPVGSMTKLMTVYLTAEAVSAGTLSLTETVTVSAAAEGVSGATVWLTAGEKMTAEDLLRAVIIGNANDACTALACRLSGSEQAFVMEMNAAAFTLGMRQTRFADCTGLSAENLSSAHDLALLGCALGAYPFLTPLFTTWRDFLRDGATELVSENRLTRNYEGILGFKAGHGEASGYTLMLAAERDGMRCLAVVLGCADADARFTDAKKLLAQGFSGFYLTTPDFAAEFLRPVTVRFGTARAVLPETGALRAVAAPKGEQITCCTVLPDYLEAPVRKGQHIGTAAFYSGDTLLYETELTAGESVPRRTLLLSLRRLLRALV